MAKHNDAGGGMTAEEAFKTTFKLILLIGFLYVLGYFFIIIMAEVAHSRTLARLLMKTIPLYPNAGPEDLDIGYIQDMSRTILYLCAIFIPVALYRKIKKQ